MSLARAIAFAMLAWVGVGSVARGDESAPTPSPARADGTRVVEFPAGRSLGQLYWIPDARLEYLCTTGSLLEAGNSNALQAMGSVTVPAGGVLCLTLMNNGEAGSEYKDLEPFSKVLSWGA